MAEGLTQPAGGVAGTLELLPLLLHAVIATIVASSRAAKYAAASEEPIDFRTHTAAGPWSGYRAY